MAQIENSIRIILLITLLIAITSLGSCGESGGTSSPETSGPLKNAGPTSPGTVTITIGNHTDMTGVSANAMEILTMALKDTVDYYNQESFIPGVELKVIDYDGQYDPSRDISGYQWLKERGADVIWSPVAGTGITLKPFVERDRMVMVMMSPNEEAFDPPGWVFSLGNARYDEQIYTLLNWLPENDPDFPKDRPARIGGAMWRESAGIAILGAAERYARAHPEYYDWEDGFLTDFSFIWTNEADALKDCDYVFPPVPPHVFVTAYRQAGGKAKFLGTDAHTAFMGMIDSAGLWEEMDGMYVIRAFRWWTEEGDLMDLTRQLLYENHPGEAEDIIRKGVGYITVQPVYMLLEAIRETVEKTGAENFSSEALYSHLQSFTINVDGCEHSLTENKRTSNDYMNIQEFRAADKDLFRAHPEDEWIPIVKAP